jgi:ATP-dependent DNA ligase
MTSLSPQFSENFQIDGRAMVARACKFALEGVVSNIRARAYLQLSKMKAEAS